MKHLFEQHETPELHSAKCKTCDGSGLDKKHTYPDGTYAACETCEGYGTTMNTTTHAPGPWKVVPHEHSDFDGLTVQSGCGLVATIPSNNCPYEEQDDENFANARLIASAPELLDALRRVMEQITDTGTCNLLEGTRAIAVIAKAEGRSE